MALAPRAALHAAEPGFQSKYLAVGFAPTHPAFTWFAVDSLGQGKLAENPVLAETNAVAVPGLELQERFTYTLNGKPVWRITGSQRTLTMCCDYVAGVESLPLVLAFDQKANHATLLGLMQAGQRQMSLPCVLHLPDRGSLRISGEGKLDYDARRHIKRPFVQIGFPPATAKNPHVEYRLEVAAIYPELPGRESDPRFDGFKRDFLNLFQVNPRVQMLANNSSSDPCAFTLFEYAEMARFAPPLTKGLTCLDLVRMTLDRYLDDVKGYGQVGFGCTPGDADLNAWQTPWTSLDSYPSLLIAACHYIQGTGDWAWARAHYGKLNAWAREMMQGDRGGTGLIAYPGTGNYGDRPLRDKRPANWWDTINFGHQDAYSNALAYRACRMWAEVAGGLARPADAQFFTSKADKLRAAYVPAFLNPDTGILAGWKSADGQLHDYWFTFVNGVAIAYGLVDAKDAQAIMDRLLHKMRAVGYTDFSLGLPGNLVPVRKGDYCAEGNPPTQYGEPRREDGSDGFEFYENGGASGCFAYFTLKALYQLGRRDDARRILYPMLAGYAAGNFQGFGDHGMSKDWRDWKGGCHGYEGLLVDNYLALLAVLDDVKTPAPLPKAAK
jgi:hypothetical protein